MTITIAVVVISALGVAVLSILFYRRSAELRRLKRQVAQLKEQLREFSRVYANCVRQLNELQGKRNVSD